MLKPFISRPRTISEAAERLGINLKLMAYYTHRMAKLGLLERVQQVPERTIKAYRVSARQYLVPFSETHFETFGNMLHEVAQMRQVTDNTATSLRQFSSDWSVLIQGNAAREDFELAFSPMTKDSGPQPIRVEQLLDSSFPAFWSSGDTLRLDPTTAKDLQRELIELLKKYKHQSGDKGQSYVLLLGLTPVQSDEGLP